MFFSSDLTDFLAGAGERQPKKKMIQTGNYSLQVAEMASGSREKKFTQEIILYRCRNGGGKIFT
jgi:hypothetical protein